MLEAQLKPNAEAGDAAFQYELALYEQTLYSIQMRLKPLIGLKAAAQQHPDADYHLGRFTGMTNE